MSTDYFLGVDAGNSKTVALVAAVDGRVVGWGRGGGGDIYASEARATAAVATAVTQALGAANLHLSDLRASCLSLVGADWPEDFTFWQREAGARGYGRKVQIVNDAIGALRAGTEGDGVAIVCGTGAAVGARHGDTLWHSSFWQEPMGGFELGERALRAVYRAELGLAPSTLLRELLLEHCACSSVEVLLHSMTARSTQTSRRPHSLSRLLLDAAASGDETALHEVDRAAAILGDYAWVAASKVGLCVGLGDAPFPLVLAGGVLRHESTLFREAIAFHVQKRLPLAVCRLTPFEPVVGALMLALETHTETSLTDYRPLEASLPLAEFFAT